MPEPCSTQNPKGAFKLPERKIKNEIQFEFRLDQKVLTPFEGKGIIHMIGVDHGGNLYSVLTKHGEQWFREEELSEDEV